MKTNPSALNLIMSFFLSLGTEAFGTEGSAALPPLLKEVDALYSNEKTLTAEFTQTTVSAVTQKKKVTSGTLKVRRPDSFRWETLRPEASLLVSDGKTYWYYTPSVFEDEPGQWFEKKSSEVHSQLLMHFCPDRFHAKDTEISVKKSDPNRFNLVPKKGTAGTLLRAEMLIDPKEKKVVEVTLFHQGGNQSEVRLSQIRLGSRINASEFQFVPPKNAEKIEPAKE